MSPQEQLKRIHDQLQKAADAKARERRDADRAAISTQIGQYLGAVMQPLKEAVTEMRRMTSSHERMASHMASMEMPEPVVNVDLSTLELPKPNITVNPIIDLADIKMPSEMDVKGWIGIMGYDRGLLTNPIPVQLRDASGNPIKLFENLTQIVGGGGGGNHVIVDSMPSISVVSSGNSSISLVNSDGTYYNSDNPLPVSFSSSTQPVIQVSGAVNSVNILQVGSNAVVVGTGYQDNALRVVHATDAIVSVNIVSGATGGTQYDDAGNAEPGTGGLSMARDSAGSVYSLRLGSGTSETALRVVQAADAIASVSVVSNIAALDVKQVSGSADSVNVMQIGGNNVVVGTGYQDNALRVVQATDAIASVNLAQTLGSATVVGTGYQDNALRVVHATDAIASVNIVSSATLTVTGSLTSSVVVGSVVGDAIDDGSAPVQMGGIARTANPTAVTGGDVVKASMDDVGRLLSRPVQVRDLLQTSRVALTTGTETTLLTGVAGVFHDLIYVMAANNSDAATYVDFRAATGANIQFTIQVPANGTAGVSLPVPLPQDVAADTWTADMPDITGTTVTVSALFSKEV